MENLHWLELVIFQLIFKALQNTPSALLLMQTQLNNTVNNKNASRKTLVNWCMGSWKELAFLLRCLSRTLLEHKVIKKTQCEGLALNRIIHGEYADNTQNMEKCLTGNI